MPRPSVDTIYMWALFLHTPAQDQFIAVRIYKSEMKGRASASATCASDSGCHASHMDAPKLVHTWICAIRIATLNMAHWSLQSSSVSGTRDTNETASVAPTKLVAPNAKESAHAILSSDQLHETQAG